jgi:hypothetical protein
MQNKMMQKLETAIDIMVLNAKVVKNNEEFEVDLLSRKKQILRRQEKIREVNIKEGSVK